MVETMVELTSRFDMRGVKYGPWEVLRPSPIHTS